jgi:hypothetical protein
MGRRRERRRWDDRAMDRIAMARVLIEEVDERWHGLARYLSNSGMDHNDDLIARLAKRQNRREMQERFRAEAQSSRQ